jgi:phosphate/sulfate permease
VKVGSIILGTLSLVAAAIGYAVAMAILSALSLPEGLADLLIIFVPLLVAGLCMAPFLVPLVDRMAKRDLEAHRAASGAAARPPLDRDTPAD